MSAIDARVRALAIDLGAAQSGHLMPDHRRDYLHGLARTIQTAIDDYLFATKAIDDRDWPIALDAEARQRSRALTDGQHNAPNP